MISITDWRFLLSCKALAVLTGSMLTLHTPVLAQGDSAMDREHGNSSIPSTPRPLIPVQSGRAIPQDRNYGYNYGSVCVFADLVEGYELPALAEDFYKDIRHFRRLSVTHQNGANIETYVYTGDGVTGRIIRRPAYAYFQASRVSSIRIPPAMRSKINLLSILQVEKTTIVGDTLSLACETHTATFYFDQDALQYVEFETGTTD